MPVAFLIAQEQVLAVHPALVEIITARLLNRVNGWMRAAGEGDAELREDFMDGLFCGWEHCIIIYQAGVNAFLLVRKQRLETRYSSVRGTGNLRQYLPIPVPFI